MPLYEYKCESCGKIFTKLQKFSDEPLTIHEECGSGPVERLISAPAFHFKGTGWYATDYAKSGAPKPEGESKSEGEKSDSKSADSKPAEGKSGESKSADTKSSESKSSSDSGSTSATKSDTKPAPSNS